ncbi:OmpA family protein [Bdellovibrio bacteriovorus]|uniref:OmpA family protein n=1 Tax=Bdellovibrio bacteriovorus TaxID=959 RepID=UPI0035A5E29B
MKLLGLFLCALIGFNVQAQAETPLYLGAHFQWATPLAPDEFKDDAGNATGFGVLGGYKFNNRWAAELGFDRFKFDDIDMTHSLTSLGAVYRFSEGFIVPYARLALGLGENEFDADGVETKKTFAGHIGAGAEFNFAPVTLYAGARVNFVGDTAGLDDASSLNLLVGLIIPSFGNGDAKSSSSTAAASENKAASVAQALAPQDSDNDGITDDKDKCPSSAAGVKVNAYGCAEKEKAVVKINVEFSAGKTTVEPQYEAEIEKLAEFMKEHKTTTVEIAGHTDNTGSAKLNTTLSQKRAQAVADVLVKKYGIESKRVKAKGYGPSKPVGDNNTEEGRKANRRVEAQISA